MNNGDADRKTRIADAAIDVLGRDGLRALTHRAVDSRAGLPQGTCSYHHRTRRSLLGAALRRIADLDRADMAAAGTDSGAVDRAVAVLRRWLGPGRVRSRARLVLMLDAEARGDLGEEAARLAGEFVAGAATALGSVERARLMVALLDGLVADDLVRGGDGPPPDPVLRARVSAAFAAVAAVQPTVPGPTGLDNHPASGHRAAQADGVGERKQPHDGVGDRRQ